MDVHELPDLPAGVHRVRFSSATQPSKGIYKVVTGAEGLLVCDTGGESLYEYLVKSRLAATGRNPADFVLSDLPWGERVGTSAVINHRGRNYLQVVVTDPGEVHAYVGDYEIPNEPEKRNNQGLPLDVQVSVRTYLVDNLTSLEVLD